MNIIKGTKGNDTLSGTDASDRIYGYAGRDVLNGGAGNDRLYGGYGNDILNGGAGDDRFFCGSGGILNGGAGDDWFFGGEGNNLLHGGTGDDIFQLTLLSTKNTLRDFSVVNDTIQIDSYEFTQLSTLGPLNPTNFLEGSAAADKNDYVIYNKSTGVLWFDADGSDPGAAQQIALLGTGTTHPALTFADFIVI